jgi:hypothetical protein
MEPAMTQRLIMIGGWAEIYKKAKEVGFYLTVVQRKEDLELDELQFIDQIIMSPVSDKIVVDLVSTIHEKYPFNAVVSFQEFGVLNAALIKERLNLRGNPLRPVALTRDKNAMRQHMQEFGLPSIPFLHVKSIQDVVDFARQHGFPLILKPANGIGSLQVHKLHSEVEIEHAFNSIKSDAYAREIITNDFPELGVIVEGVVSANRRNFPASPVTRNSAGWGCATPKTRSSGNATGVRGKQAPWHLDRRGGLRPRGVSANPICFRRRVLQAMRLMSAVSGQPWHPDRRTAFDQVNGRLSAPLLSSLRWPAAPGPPTAVIGPLGIGARKLSFRPPQA